MEKQQQRLTLLAFFCLFQAATAAFIFYPQLPVSTRTLFKAQIALNNWEQNLDATYRTPKENPNRIKRDTDLVVGQLGQMSKELAAYDNVVLGAQNGLVGSKNIIIGNGNSVFGNNNFIFSQGFYYANVKGGSPASAISNVLVNDNWVAELDKRREIPTNLHNVIYPYYQ